MVLASGTTRQDPNPAGILTQMVIRPTPTHIQYLKWQAYHKAKKIFIALIAKATFPKFSHYYLLIPRGYVQKSCCINAKKHRNGGWRRILWKSSSLTSPGEQTCASTGSGQPMALPSQRSRGRGSSSFKLPPTLPPLISLLNGRVHLQFTSEQLCYICIF